MDESAKAKEHALRCLSGRAHGEQELYRKLAEKHGADAASDAVLAMRELHLLDDAVFARQKAEYLAGRGKSTADIMRRLALLGIDRDTARAAVQNLDIDEETLVFDTIRRYYLDKLAKGKTQNVAAALLRRGFSSRTVYAAVKAAQAEFCPHAADLDLAGQAGRGWDALGMADDPGEI